MALKIEEVEGIGPVYAQKLIAVGVKTDVDMLERAGSAQGSCRPGRSDRH